MKQYRSADGEERVSFQNDEIELMMEDELRSASLMPTSDHPVVDVERFVEQHLKAQLDQHANLEANVLGMTEFNPRKPPRVSINADLTGSALDDDDSAPGLRGRWRATVAHEAAHIILHRMLFELNPDQGTLIDAATTGSHPRLMRCLKPEVLFRSLASNWREVQANKGMAALLMPRKMFSKVTRTQLAELGSGTDIRAGSDQALLLAGRLAGRFDVSKQAASIRLATLGFTTAASAQRLST
jgi:hypothetical protein